MKRMEDKDWADVLEPYTAGLGLLGDAIGIGTAATGVGIPIGAAIAGVSNIPNLIIDGYQTIRDWNKTINNKGEGLGSALWNTGETALDLVGMKAAMRVGKYITNKQFTDKLAGRIQDELKKRQGHRVILRKKGLSNKEIDEYLLNKATNAAVNSKDIINSIRKYNEKGKRIGLITNYTVDALDNISHIAKNDTIQVQRPIEPTRIKRTLKGDY